VKTAGRHPEIFQLGTIALTQVSESWVSTSAVCATSKTLDDSDVADLLPVIRVRVVNWLVRRGIVQGRDDLTLDAHDDVDPRLAQPSRAAVSGSIPAGPEIHQRPPVSLRGQSESAVVSPACASSMSFTLHAAITVSASDARAREALVRYIMRPPLAQERRHLLPDNFVRIELKRAFRDGTVAIDLDPLSLLCRLAAAGRGNGVAREAHGARAEEHASQRLKR